MGHKFKKTMQFCNIVEIICCSFLSLVPKLFVNSLLTWAIYVQLYIICPSFKTFSRTFLDFIAIILYFLSTTSYLMVVFTGPGSPLDFPSLRGSNDNNNNNNIPLQISHGITSKQNGKPRFCGKCHCWKPDRTHHCSSCNKCILKMDHHCPWFATCIGFKNHKFFLLFLTYVSIFATFTFSTSFYSLWYIHGANLDINNISINHILLLVLSIVSAITVALFAIYSYYLVFTNQTTLESMESIKYKSPVSINSSIYYKYAQLPSSTSYGNVFNIGYLNNFKQVMGNSYWIWFLPVHSSIGDGTCFPMNNDVKERILDRTRQDIELMNRVGSSMV